MPGSCANGLIRQGGYSSFCLRPSSNQMGVHSGLARQGFAERRQWPREAAAAAGHPARLLSHGPQLAGRCDCQLDQAGLLAARGATG